ncbi:hypothetical protein AN958_12225 [Leucoagaricus sp. SymC.cos]|nr:hypothetical protein AN958_12225 [Leucoagaricus sp. SymC.cos]
MSSNAPSDTSYYSNQSQSAISSSTIALSSLTRYRATQFTHAPMNLMVEMHYEQHTSVSGTLLITEATFIAANAGGEQIYLVYGIKNRLTRGRR